MEKPKKKLRFDTPPFVIFPGDHNVNVSLVGGKANSLAELARVVRVPPSFFVTTAAYKLFIETNSRLKKQISELDALSQTWIERVQTSNPVDELEDLLRERGAHIRKTIKESILPKELMEAIQKSYAKLCRQTKKTNVDAAVRSSCVTEDSIGASSAGQYSTFLNQRGKNQVVQAVRDCFESNFTDRVIAYRNRQRMLQPDSDVFSHEKSQLAVAIQQMVKADIAGIAFSIDPNTGASIVKIDASYGLGESVVSGEVSPDCFMVDPKTGVIISRYRGDKSIEKIYADKGGVVTRAVPESRRNRFCLSDEQVKEIAKQVIRIKTHYGKHVDTEFAYDETGLFFVQARPETVRSQEDFNVISMKTKKIDPTAIGKAVKVFTAGKSGSPGVASGQVIVANTVSEAREKLKKIPKDKKPILLAPRTDPDWGEDLPKFAAIITESGGPNCHAAIISRELGIPAIVGIGTDLYEKFTSKKSEKNIDGKIVTLDSNEETVYQGALPLIDSGEDINMRELLGHPNRTKLGLILATPDSAAKMHVLSGLGSNFLISLLRLEFVLGSQIGIHVRALEDYDKKKLNDSVLEKQIKDKIAGYKNGKDYYVTKLSEGIASFAAMFPESEITVRTTDFKTNEYGQLIGGNKYEKPEDNPMMGLRGLVRASLPENHEVVRWELEAIKRARGMGYKNIKLMFPVVRHPCELTGSLDMKKMGCKGIFQLMNEVGLVRGSGGMKTGIMVEIPANVWCIDEFAATGIDFISFGTNDLTQSTLLADRDSGALAKFPWLRESHPAIIKQVQYVIRKCKELGVDAGICGNAPSNFPEFAAMLVNEGIGSIGVTVDRYLPTHRLIGQVETSKNNLSG